VTRVVLLVALLTAHLAASAAADPPPPRVSCGAGKAVDVFFWPHGHPALPSLHHARSAVPHVEVYRGATRVAYLDEQGPSFAKACVASVMTAVTFAGVGRQSAAAARRITCRLPARAQLVAQRGVDGTNLWVMAGAGTKAVLWVALGAAGPQASWLRRYCTAKPVPG
jgi:hypothetical protein